MTLDLDHLHNLCDIINRGETFPPLIKGKTTALLYMMVGEAALGESGNTYLYVCGADQYQHNYNKFLALLADNEIPHCIEPEYGVVRTWVKCELGFNRQRIYSQTHAHTHGHMFWFVRYPDIQHLVQRSYRYSRIFVDFPANTTESNYILDNILRYTVQKESDIIMG